MTETPLKLTELSQRRDLLEPIAARLNDAYPQSFTSESPAIVLNRHLGDSESLPCTLIALHDERLAGTVSIEVTVLYTTDLDGPWIVWPYVDPDHRNQGLGRLLVTAASRVAWQLGHETLYAATHAPEFFEAIGWETVEDTDPGPTFLRFHRPAAPPSYYEQIGGEDTVRRLVDRFYDLMDTLDEVAEIRAMHATSLKSSRQKLFEFLSGWLGGPNLYVEKRGHPRLRMRHMPFEIGTQARDQWLRCMDQALDEVIEDEATREKLRDSFVHMADHMRNRRGP